MKKVFYEGKDHEQLFQYLKKQKSQYTYERATILEYIIKMDSHFTAMALTDYINKYQPIGRTSIYNTLNLFLSANLIIRHPFVSEKEFVYELTSRAEKHHHLVCTSCGYVQEFSDVKLDKSFTRRKHSTFYRTHRALYFYGICQNCQNNEKTL